jgi:hypothetical protein
MLTTCAPSGDLAKEARSPADKRAKRGIQAVTSIARSKNAKSGGAACAAWTVVNGGSELLIFVVPKASDRGLLMW